MFLVQNNKKMKEVTGDLSGAPDDESQILHVLIG